MSGLGARQPPTPPGSMSGFAVFRASVALQILGIASGHAVTLVQVDIWGALHVPGDPASEIRITVSFSHEPWQMDRHVPGSDDAPPVYVQVYHDPTFPTPVGLDTEFDPYRVIVRWDAPAPGGSEEALAGSTAWVHFGDFTATIDPDDPQPSPACFYYTSDVETQSMTLVWTNLEPPDGLCVPEPGMPLFVIPAAMVVLLRRRRRSAADSRPPGPHSPPG